MGFEMSLPSLAAAAILLAIGGLIAGAYGAAAAAEGAGYQPAGLTGACALAAGTVVLAEALELQVSDAGYVAIAGCAIGAALGIWVLAWGIAKYKGAHKASCIIPVALGAFDMAFAACVLAAALL